MNQINDGDIIFMSSVTFVQGGIVAKVHRGSASLYTPQDGGMDDAIVAVTTSTGTSAAETYRLSSAHDSIRIWTGETPVTEPWFFLYITRSGVTTKIKLNRFEARIINVPGKTFGLATSDGRTVYVAPNTKPSSLGTSFPVSGTANADAGGPPIWSPSAAHITLPAGQNQYELVGSGTERIVFVSEYDGSTWSPARWLRLPASGSIRLFSTYRQIALANYDGAAVSVNGPTGTVIGGTSAASSITMPSVTGTTHNVSTVAQLKTAIGAAVAGDEIVLAAGTYAMDVNITAASFTANNGVGGRVGMEGITIRGATSDRTLYIIGCAANGQGNWDITQTGATLRSGLKDITFSFAGSNTAGFKITRGIWSMQNVRFTGTIGSGINNFIAYGFNGANGLKLDAYKCSSDNSIADCWSFFDGNTTETQNLVRLIDCLGYTAGAASAHQCLTTHNTLPVLVYGGHFYDAHTNVIANGTNNELCRLFFTKTSKGARQGITVNTSCFGSYIGQMQATATGWWANGCVANVVEGGVSEASARNTQYEGNLFTNTGAIATYYGFFVYVDTTTTFERNVCSGFNWGIRLNFGTPPGSNSANRNTLIGCTLGVERNVAFTTQLNGNVTKNSVTRGMSVTAGGMVNLSVSYNIWDVANDADYVPGSNDIIPATAALDSNYLPTAAGNCDGTGNPSAIDWVGGTDYVGFLLEISSTTRDRGARCRPRIITNAEMTPDIW